MNTENVIEWLLSGPPWVEYRTRRDLLNQSEEDPRVRTARQAMLAHPQVRGLLAELTAWPGTPLKRHNEAGHLLHKLGFIADLGLRASDAGVDEIIDRILACRSGEGMFQVGTNISPHYGGTGRDELVWMLCDSPLIVYALAKMGLQSDEGVQAAARHMASLLRPNGWPCAVAPELGKFRGPGRKEHPCPYATLIVLKALAQFPQWRDGDACHTGAESLLDLWQRRKETKPYLFAMGTDFTKLKAPLVWYDILHLVNGLSRFDWLRRDGRLQEMKNIINEKADAEGRFTPESIWTAWKDWDFGQKRLPSYWLTYLACRVLTG